MRVLSFRIGAGAILAAVLALVIATPGLAATSITSFTPAFAVLQGGGGGTCDGGVITINGNGFVSGGPVSVSFNGTPAAWVSVGGDTKLFAIPAAATTTGPITVTNAGGSATSATPFYPYQCWWSTSDSDVTPLTIVNITPTKVNPGKKITINGSAFTAATKVTIGGASATFTVNSGIKITATVPTGAKSGKATVQVTTPTGSISGQVTIG